jgi:hypothetical protein
MVFKERSFIRGLKALGFFSVTDVPVRGDVVDFVRSFFFRCDSCFASAVLFEKIDQSQ